MRKIGVPKLVWVIETRIKGRFLPVMLVHVIVTQKIVHGLPLIGSNSINIII